MAKITAIIPTLNEEKRILNALNSVAFADEIIVIDSYSTDKTVEIASHFGATIYQRKFDDFSSQKNYAISKATYDWVFLLDADEIASTKLQKEIVEKVKNPMNNVGFFVFRKFYFGNKHLRFSGLSNDKVIRLFLKTKCFYQGKVHEKIVADGPVGLLSEKIAHFSFESKSQYKTKLMRYATIQAQVLISKKKQINVYHLYLKPLVRFFIHYFLKLGFLDGKEGFIMATWFAKGVYYRYAKFKCFQKYGLPDSKILHIGFDAKRAFHNNSGLGNYSRDMIKNLADFFPNNNYFLYNPKPKKIERLKLKTNIIEVLPSTKIWKFFSSIWRQGPILKQINNDKIAIFHGLSGEIPRGIKIHTNCKVVVTVHDLIFVRYPNLYSYFDQKIHLQKVKYATNFADKIIAISEQTKQDLIEYLKVPEHKIEVVYQGCHPTFKEEKSREVIDAVLKKFNLPEKFILNVGTIEPRKNSLVLLKAIQNIDIQLVIVGRKTFYFKILEHYIQQNQLQKKVIFLEGVNMYELSAIYQQAKVFLYPSIFEGFGIPIIEALYSKTPVITNKDGVFKEAGGSYSTYVDVTNPVEISEKIKYLLENQTLVNEMVAKSYDFVQQFNDNIIAKKMHDVYEKLN